MTIDSESTSVDDYSVYIQNGETTITDIQPWSLIELADHDIFELGI